MGEVQPPFMQQAPDIGGIGGQGFGVQVPPSVKPPEQEPWATYVQTPAMQQVPIMPPTHVQEGGPEQ
jgi:hypothetical protein